METFYTREGFSIDLFLHSLIMKLLKQVEVTKEDHDRLDKYDMDFNPVKGS